MLKLGDIPQLLAIHDIPVLMASAFCKCLRAKTELFAQLKKNFFPAMVAVYKLWITKILVYHGKQFPSAKEEEEQGNKFVQRL